MSNFKKLSDAPVMPEEKKVFEEFGLQRTDEYFWFRDKEDSRVKPHLAAENEYFHKTLEPFGPLRNAFKKEMLAFEVEEYTTCPFEWNGFEYFKQFKKGKEHPIYCRKKDESVETLFDVNAFVEDFPNAQVMGWQPSPSHEKIAFVLDKDGSERGRLFIMDLVHSNLEEQSVEDLSGQTEWLNENELCFVTLSEEWRPNQVWRYNLDNGEKSLEYEEKDPKFFVGIEQSISKKYIILQAHSKVTSEARLLDVSLPEKGFEVFKLREQGVEFELDHHPEIGFIAQTNALTPNFSLLKGDASRSWGEWEVLFAGNDEICLSSYVIDKDALALFYFEKGVSRCSVLNLSSNELSALSFGEDASVVSPGTNAEIGNNKVQINFQSLRTPPKTFLVDLLNGEKSEIYQKEVPGFDPNQYETTVEWVVSEDGFRFPVSLMWKKGLDLNSKNPCLLYGYGSYGSEMKPGFWKGIVPLVDRGVVFAMAHIRGGGELGQKTYVEQGKFLTKKNTFIDFEAAALHLTDKNIAREKGIVLMGGSAGGLLVGATLNRNPNFYAGALGFVAFVDVLNTMQDGSLPLTPIEWEEWGDPRNEEFYHYIKSYSPYDNIERSEYPPTLFTGGWNDPRVTYWEPAKMVARLRKLNQSDAPILLFTEMGAGHMGSSGRFAYIDDMARDYTFIAACLDLKV